MTRRLSVKAKVSSLALAVALVAGPSPAAAQSFNGTGSFVTNSGGSANITTGSGTTDITLNGGQTIIDWTPTPDGGSSGTNIIFQAGGTTATFSSASNFAVLNRISQSDLTRAIEMDGAINSLVGGQTGGSVYFYSPSGFVLGATSAINVGSLVLTASPLVLDGNNNFISGTSVTFGAADSATSKIVTMPGSAISALNQGSYVAMVAPRVEHHGSIAVNGSAALVGAEAATINFSPDGLFDITVTTGTTNANGVAVYGDITGPASDGSAGDNQRVYLVAVPKNTALTMVIAAGADLGFTLAGSASIDDKGGVVLGAGNDIAFGSLNGESAAAGAAASLSLNAAHVTSGFEADATGVVNVFSNSGQATSFDSGVSIHSRGNLTMSASGTGTIDVGGDLYLSTDIFGTGPAVTAADVRFQIFDDAVATLGGNVTLSANAQGQLAPDNGLNGGNATGGTALVQTNGNGSITIAGDLDVHADGQGGHNFSGDGAGGNGTGGTAQILANGSASSIDVTGIVTVTAKGEGGSNRECSACNITGGNGTGGQIDVNAAGSAGNSLHFGSDVTLSAAGFGGSGDLGGGDGHGGRANLAAADGGTTTLLGDTIVDASGFGGFGYASTGGTGTGGLAVITTFGTAGSLVDLNGDVFVTADGIGGDVGSFGTLGQGGTGTGGQAEVSAVRGTIHAHNNLFVSAQSNGGTVSFGGGHGGDGTAIPTGVDLTEAGLFASAGTLIVDGLTALDASATGGDGALGGNGGDAVAAGVSGTIGGGAVVHAANSDAGQSVIQLANVVAIADAQGGQGGDGQGGVNGGDGGNGGSATGGKAIITAAAGSGDVSTGAAILSASATGGTGGSGGNSDGGTGGNGGNGGNATGGFINVGTESGNVNFAQGANNGIANYASIMALTDATGGTGGDGTAGTISGVGGSGGDAFGGSSTLLVRGSEVIVGTVSLDASATGGDGGLSPDTANGDGGDATTGSVGVLVTNRFNLPLQRGTLTAGDITGTATATGGTGGLGDGQSLSLGGNQFIVSNSDATINSVALTQIADGLDLAAPATFNSPVAVVNGTVDITGGFIFSTPGTASVYADSGTLSAQAITLVAFNFIHDDSPARPGPAVIGTFSANNINLTTGQDLIVDGHLLSLNGVGFTAPGRIDFDNVTSVNGPVTLAAGGTVDAGNLSAATLVSVNGGGGVTLGSISASTQQAIVISNNGDIATGAINAGTFIGINAPLGSITTGNLDAGSFVSLFAQDDIDGGNVDAGTSIDVESANGAITLNDLAAATTINLDAPVSITFADVTAADDFDFSSGGTVTGSDIIAGTFAGGDAGGAVSLGSINVGILQSGGPSEDGFAVGITSATSISVGDVAADEAIGFATLGNLIAGDLNAGTDVMTLIGGNTTIASITTPNTGRTYHGDVQMFLDAGGTDNFDPSLVFNATPVRSGGSYTVTGAISTGRILVGAASISTAAITAPIGIYLDSTNGTTTAALASGGLIHAISGGSIGTGNVQSSGANILFEAGTNITSGTVGAATDAEFDAGGNVSIGAANIGSDLVVDAGGNFTSGAVVAATIHATAGGLATLNGMWQAPDVDLLSNDIDIAANGGIDAGSSGSIRLGSTNATQALIGDGLNGSGYTLTDAEFGRLSTGNLQIAARGDASAAIDMLIGDLSITGPLAGSTIDDPFGSVVFATGDPLTQTPGGVIRVTGSVTAAGFTADNRVEFFADRFELDAETGLLQITGNGTELSGEIFIDADRIHAASSSILDQLAANPDYAGHEDDLNAPANVQRPDGIMRAASIEVFSSGPLSVLMQNTGTAATPAGFLTLGDEPLLTGAEGQIGPIEMIINGQLLTDGGLLTGADVLDFLIDANNIGFFTANSTINGCSLTGTCTGSSPIPPGSTPTPGIQDEVTLVDDDAFPEPPFGNEDVIDDNDEDSDDSETSPIVPPDPLFDTSELGDAAGSDAPDVAGTPMRSTPGLTNSGDVDDPVSGSGNPGLMENPPPPTNEEKQQ